MSALKSSSGKIKNVDLRLSVALFCDKHQLSYNDYINTPSWLIETMEAIDTAHTTHHNLESRKAKSQTKLKK